MNRAHLLAQTAVATLGVIGRSAHALDGADRDRATGRFLGANAVFTRAVDLGSAAEGADDDGGEPENVEVKDGEAFSFDAVASVGTRRLMWHPTLCRVVWEELDITPDSVDLSYLEARSGIPFFREHYYWWGAQLGKVTSLDVEAGKITARAIRLSRHDDVKRYRMDVADGLADAVSLGYRHVEYTVTEQTDDYPICRVTKILPIELSATSMPADAWCGIIEASIRSAYPNDDAPEAAVLAARPATAGGTPAARADTQENMTVTTPATGATGADPVVTRADAPVVPPVAQPAQAPAFDAAAFATRSAELVTIARQAGMADDVLTRAIADPSVTVDAFRSQAFTIMVGRQTPGITAGNDVATRGDHREAMIDAMVARATGAAPTGLAATYMRHSLGDFALESLNAAGETGLTRHDRTAIFTRAMHVTADFGGLLTAAATKILVNLGNDTDLPFRTIARRMDLSNFLPNTLVNFDNFPRLKKIAEDGEIRFGTVAGGGFDVSLKTYWLALSVTRQMFVNDGFGVFSDILGTTSLTVPAQQNDIVFMALIAEAGKVVAGGTSRALIRDVNLLPDGTALDDAGLDKAITLMTMRKRRDGGRTGIKPKYLIHGPLLRTTALRQTTAVIANATGDINVNTNLVPVMDASIPGRSWFLIADPALGVPALAYGGLEGEQGTMVYPWERVRGKDGFECEVGMDFHGSVASSHAIVGSLDAAAVAAALQG